VEGRVKEGRGRTGKGKERGEDRREGKSASPFQIPGSATESEGEALSSI